MTGARSVEKTDVSSADHGTVTVSVAELPSEVVRLVSVGIDVGSATLQVVCSRLELRRRSASLSSDFEVVSREVLWASEPIFTPYAPDGSIDAAALTEMVRAGFGRAGADPSQVITGAVILTGEAVRRRNAHAIARSLSADFGDFVSATAGHRLEAVLSAHGSGAVELSRRTRSRVLHVDIGGGTTKLVDIDAGRIRTTAAVHVGARLAVLSDGLLVRLEPVAQRLASRCGAAWTTGGPVDAEDLRRTVELMADVVVAAAVGGGAVPPGYEDLQLAVSLEPWQAEEISAVTFSGGVSEFVYGREDRDFGDLGRLLGRAVRHRLDQSGRWTLATLPDGMRATVLGASQYSGQVSGSTVHVSAGAPLPLHDLRVVPLSLPEDVDLRPAAVAASVTECLAELGLQEGEDPLALAVRWAGPPSHRRLSALAEGVVTALRRTVEQRKPVVLLLDADLGRAAGVLLEQEQRWPAPVVAIDGIALSDFDHVDISPPLPNGSLLVTIKSLVFAM